MNVDTTALIQSAANLGSCLSGIAALALSLLAILTVRQWKTELRFKTRFEVARDVTRLLYKILDELTYVRSPIFSEHDAKDRLTQQNEDPRMKRILNEAYIRQQRLKDLDEVLTKFEEVTSECSLIFESEIVDAIAVFKARLQELSLSSRLYFEPGYHIYVTDTNPEEARRLMEIVYGTSDDSFSQSLREQVRVIIRRLQKELQ